MKINYALVSRSLIALLFVLAGVQKAMDFTATSSFLTSLNVPVPALATLIVIIVEVPVALLFAYGYKVRETGYILIGFTVLATALVHPKIFGQDMVMALKNIAIIGGIMSAIACTCTNCMVHGKKG